MSSMLTSKGYVIVNKRGSIIGSLFIIAFAITYILIVFGNAPVSFQNHVVMNSVSLDLKELSTSKIHPTATIDMEKPTSVLSAPAEAVQSIREPFLHQSSNGYMATIEAYYVNLSTSPM